MGYFSNEHDNKERYDGYNEITDEQIDFINHKKNNNKKKVKKQEEVDPNQLDFFGVLKNTNNKIQEDIKNFDHSYYNHNDLVEYFYQKLLNNDPISNPIDEYTSLLDYMEENIQNEDINYNVIDEQIDELIQNIFAFEKENEERIHVDNRHYIFSITLSLKELKQRRLKLNFIKSLVNKKLINEIDYMLLGEIDSKLEAINAKVDAVNKYFSYLKKVDLTKKLFNRVDYNKKEEKEEIIYEEDLLIQEMLNLKKNNNEIDFGPLFLYISELRLIKKQRINIQNTLNTLVKKLDSQPNESAEIKKDILEEQQNILFLDQRLSNIKNELENIKRSVSDGRAK